MKKFALIADDEPDIRDLLVDLITNEFPHWGIVQASDGTEAIRKIRNQKFSLLVCDINMPKATGIDVMESLTKIEKDKKPDFVVMISGRFNREQADKMNTSNSIRFLPKPFQMEEIKEVLFGMYPDTKDR